MSEAQPPPDPEHFRGYREKDIGWLGPRRLKGGGVATEYSIGVPIDGEEMEIPTLVPTLTEEEIRQMTEEIIPGRKKIPEVILKKAVAHAQERVRAGKSPFFSSYEALGMRR